MNEKNLLFLPVGLLIFAFFTLAFNLVTTGSVIEKGIDLKGGSVVSFEYAEDVDTEALEAYIMKNLDVKDVRVTRAESLTGKSVTVEIDRESKELISIISQFLGEDLEKLGYSENYRGPALAATFWIQAKYALIVAFLLMGLIVFLNFRILVPSFAVILAAFSDIVVTTAIMSVLGMVLTLPTIAALLMLLGYSVDSNILLTTRILKRKGTFDENIAQARGTGITMSITTLGALIALLIISNVAELDQIASVLIIGLLIDLINTWIQNSSILRIYMERKK